jgi:polyisoprenyl-teichoic acid--peptidoglycan teichoic acid transferase
MRGRQLSQPSGDKPYKKYRAGRLRSRHAHDRIDLPPESEKARARQANGRNGTTAKALRPPRAHTPDPRSEGPRSRSRFRRFRWRYVVLALLVPILIAATIVGVWSYKGYGRFDAAVKRSNHRIDRATRRALSPDAGSLLKHPTTILVLGTDARDNAPSRSDTILLLRFNPKKHTVTQLSIARDTMVAVEGHGDTKINEAFYWGGAPLAIETVRRYTGIPLNHLMIVRFRGFRKLINGVGGITVNVPEDVSSEYIGGRVVHFKKGKQSMNGDEALVYARIRKSDDDFHRMGRQQQVVQALEKAIVQPGNVLDLPSIGCDFMRGVRTELNTNELLTLAYLQWRTEPRHVYKYVLQGDTAMIGGRSFVVVDPAIKERTMRLFLSK